MRHAGSKADRAAPAVRFRRAPTALVCGVCGQDGVHLAAHLLRLGYRVIGTSRDPDRCDRGGLERFGIAGRVSIEALHPARDDSARRLFERVMPDEIYLLGCQSSVARSYAAPAEAFTSIAIGTANVLEALRVTGLASRLFVAGSVAMFGDTGGVAVDESTVPRPVDPYGVAKATAAALVAQYRRCHGVHACTGILANHESPLRPETFVTQKIAAAVERIAAGDRAPLVLGDLSIERDWGWAAEYVEAMHAMLVAEEPEDLVIGTGESTTLEAFVAEAFAHAGLDWRRHVVHDPALVRAGEPRRQSVDPGRAAARIGWRATVTADEVARRMVDARRDRDGAVRRAA